MAQLALLPTEVSTSERGVVSACLHVATNTFDDGSVFNLPRAGGPAIASLKVTSLATLARAAFKTLPEWKKCCQILENITDDMPGGFLVSNVANPACWDSPPFAFNLRMVAECFEPTPIIDATLKPSHFINKARERLAKAAANVARELRGPRFPTRGRKVNQRGWHVQKQFAAAFKEALLPSSLETLLEARFLKHFAPLCPLGFAPQWEELLTCLRQAQPHFAMAALKTLLNSWCTRGRYHDESAKNCVFGCAGAPDDITHYVCCPMLWGICAHASGTRHPRTVEECILVREPSAQSIDLLVTAFTTYHAIKLGNELAVAIAERSANYSALTALANDIAKAQWLKMGRKYQITTTAALGGSSSDVAANLLVASAGEEGVPIDTSGFRGFSARGESLDSSDPRAYCEPECSDMEAGSHHPCCSQYDDDAYERYQPA